MSGAIGICNICHRPITDRTQAVVPITGYERLRKTGGVNTVLFKNRLPDRIYHYDCLERKKRGDALPGLGKEAA